MPIRVDGSSSSTSSPGSEPLLRQGASGAAVLRLQQLLQGAGYDVGGADGQFGPHTQRAVEAFQRDHGLGADGVVGPRTWGALDGLASGSTGSTGGVTGPGDGFDPPKGRSYAARGTGYYPDSSALEGGFTDRQGKPLHTLQDFLAGDAPYVSVAMDSTAFPYGTRLRIPELEAKYGRPIEFRVVDTGGAFRGKGTSRIDICTANQRASLDPTINGQLHLIVQP